MKMRDGRRNLSNIKLYTVFQKTALPMQKPIEVAPFCKVHHKVYSILPLKYILHLDNKRMRNLKHYDALEFNVLQAIKV